MKMMIDNHHHPHNHHHQIGEYQRTGVLEDELQLSAVALANPFLSAKSVSSIIIIITAIIIYHHDHTIIIYHRCRHHPYFQAPSCLHAFAQLSDFSKLRKQGRYSGIGQVIIMMIIMVIMVVIAMTILMITID